MTGRRLAALALYLALVGGGFLIVQLLPDAASLEIRPANEPEVHRMIMLVMLSFILASALPFVPGAEIGLGLIAILGAQIVPLVYLSMVLALTLAFLAGRFVPTRIVAGVFGYLGLARARDLVQAAAAMDPEARGRYFAERAPHRFVPFLIRHRYLALAAAINLPGNALVGGGGGLAMAAGISGLFPVLRYVLTILLAVAPVPLLVLVTGYQP